MSPAQAHAILKRYEANLYADLYKSRWDTAYAAKVVPNLIDCLSVDDKSILKRTLFAINLIGPEAHAAGRAVCLVLDHSDLSVRIAAAYALTGAWYRKGRQAIKPLVQAARDPAMLKDVMFNLIRLGESAKPATPIFVAALNSRDGRIRRLALRGLREIGADGPDVMRVLERAGKDKNSQVRSAAAKHLQKLRGQSATTSLKKVKGKRAPG